LLIHRSHSFEALRHSDDGRKQADVTRRPAQFGRLEGPRFAPEKEGFMKLYSLVLFSHIVGTTGLFAGLAIEWVTLRALKRADPAETRIWINLWPRLLPLTIASAILLIASGIYLAATASAFSQGWIQVSMLSLLIIAPLGAVASKRMQAIGAEANRAKGVPTIVPLAVSCRTAIALGVVMLMTIRSNRTESVAVVAIAAAAGLLHGVVTHKVPRTTRPYEHIEKSEAL
jgi:hypothetical protein